MKNKQINLRSTATFALALLYLINVIIMTEWLGLLTSFVLVVVLLLSLPAVKGASRTIGIGLFIVGGMLFIWQGAEPALWFHGLNKS